MKDEAVRASIARVGHRAAALMVEHEDWTVNECLQVAMLEEAALYGVPGEQRPQGLIGRSVIDDLRR